MKRLTVAALAAVLCGTACASDSVLMDRHFGKGFDDEAEFSESRQELPPLPDTAAGDWFDLYVEEGYSGRPRILLSSVRTAPDGSIRYIINARSAQGHDNVSAEGMLCTIGTKMFNSGGAKLKTFGYGDYAGKRWIEPRQSDWQVIGGQRNSVSRLRSVLFDAFCIDGTPTDDEKLRQRLRERAGHEHVFSYGK